MIASEQTILFTSSAVYVVSFLVFLGWLSRVDRSAWRFCVPIVAVLGLSSVLNPLDAIGITATVGGESVRVLNIVDDSISYTIVFAVVALLGGASRRILAMIAVAVFTARISFEPANIGLVEGTGALASVSIVFIGFFTVVWLLTGPVWQSAQSVSVAQRIVHWKARNLVVLIFSVLVLTGAISVAGLLNPFEQRVVLEHLNVVIRVGVGVFVFTNVAALTDERAPIEDTVGKRTGSSTD